MSMHCISYFLLHQATIFLRETCTLHPTFTISPLYNYLKTSVQFLRLTSSLMEKKLNFLQAEVKKSQAKAEEWREALPLCFSSRRVCSGELGRDGGGQDAGTVILGKEKLRLQLSSDGAQCGNIMKSSSGASLSPCPWPCPFLLSLLYLVETGTVV